MYNIFPCDGQMFISSLSSVQINSGKQAVLKQSHQPFPVQAVSMSCHNDP